MHSSRMHTTRLRMVPGCWVGGGGGYRSMTFPSLGEVVDLLHWTGGRWLTLTLAGGWLTSDPGRGGGGGG